MTSRQRYTPNPCDSCRSRHRKCDGQRPCSHCVKSKVACEALGTSFKFKNGRRRRQSFDFSPNQEWVDYSRTGSLSYVHTTQKSGFEVEGVSPLAKDDMQRDSQDVSTTSLASSLQSISRMPAETFQMEENKPEMTGVVHNESPNEDGPGIHYTPISEIGPSYDPMETQPFFTDPPTVSSEERKLIHASLPAFPAERDRYQLGPLKGLPDSYTDKSYTNLEEACLIRHFTENLAPWFDTCDRDRHFELHVPQRAMFCPVLRYAVLTASAGHLIRMASCRRDSNAVAIDGIKLPRITIDTVVHYHDTCISYLLELSKDSNEQYNEDVLTAATILRFYEQIDAPSIGIDSEAYLSTVQFIVSSQQNESFYAYETIHGPRRNRDIHAIPSTSLRHSACLIALRQEIWSGFLNQRTFRLPVCPTNDYTQFDPVNDFTWTNRILVWCADLLKFCFGEGKSLPFSEKMKRWSALKAFDLKWELNKPLEFKPLYFEEADPSAGKFFPVIWHQNACQAVGSQHIELSRILLAVSDPKLTRLGLAARQANLALEEELRCIIRRLVGLALSNSKCPVLFVDAAVGISVCGEYLTDPAEQNAILEFLADLEFQHAWPTAATASALKEAWQMRALS